MIGKIQVQVSDTTMLQHFTTAEKKFLLIKHSSLDDSVVATLRSSAETGLSELSKTEGLRKTSKIGVEKAGRVRL